MGDLSGAHILGYMILRLSTPQPLRSMLAIITRFWLWLKSSGILTSGEQCLSAIKQCTLSYEPLGTHTRVHSANSAEARILPLRLAKENIHCKDLHHNDEVLHPHLHVCYCLMKNLQSTVHPDETSIAASSEKAA